MLDAGAQMEARGDVVGQEEGNKASGDGTEHCPPPSNLLHLVLDLLRIMLIERKKQVEIDLFVDVAA